MDSMCIDLMQRTDPPIRGTARKEHIDHIQDIIRRRKAFCEDPKQNQDDFDYTSYDGLWSLMKEKGMAKKSSYPNRV